MVPQYRLMCYECQFQVKTLLNALQRSHQAFIDYQKMLFTPYFIYQTYHIRKGK